MISKSKAIILLAAIICFFTYFSPETDASEGGINWYSYEEGMAAGKKMNKKVFLVFHADWCRYCKIMEKETFQDPAVIAYLNRNFISVSVNSDKEKNIAVKFNVRGLPSTWFISENGDRIGNRPGYISAKEMINILKYLGTDSYQNMTFKAFMKDNTN